MHTPQQQQQQQQHLYTGASRGQLDIRALDAILCAHCANVCDQCVFPVSCALHVLLRVSSRQSHGADALPALLLSLGESAS
jgi:hypothetical protein